MKINIVFFTTLAIFLFESLSNAISTSPIKIPVIGAVATEIPTYTLSATYSPKPAVTPSYTPIPLQSLYPFITLQDTGLILPISK